MHLTRTCRGTQDIPTCLAVPELRKPSFLIHHFAMAAVAFSGLVPQQAPSDLSALLVPQRRALLLPPRAVNVGPGLLSTPGGG